MKKETRYEMLTHIDQKFIDEAYPKKRNIASVLIPVAACACVLALIAPAVIMGLPASSPEAAEQGIVLQGIVSYRESTSEETKGTQPSSTQTDQNAEAETPEALPDGSSGDIVLGITPEGTLIRDPRGKEYYLSGYSSLNLATAEETSFSNYPISYDLVGNDEPDGTRSLTTWAEVCEYYGKDLSPAYLPSGLIAPTEAGNEQLWSVFQVRRYGSINEDKQETIDKVQMYYFENYGSEGEICPSFSFLNEATDEFNMGLNYYIHDDQVPKGHFSPTNRGVYIVADSTNYADVTETHLYRVLIQNSEESVSYYHGVPVVFYTDSDYTAVCGYDGAEALTERNDPHLTAKYQTLLEQFLSDCLEKGMDLRADGWSYQNRLNWNDILVENGFPEEDTGGVIYYAALIYDGVMYKLSSNLDFETFAAVVASLIHD